MRWAAFLAVWLLGLALAAAEERTFSVCWWNVENWGETDRRIDGQFLPHAMKPPREVASVLAILKRVRPDILGVAEIIQAPDDKNLALFRRELAAEGLDYPYVSTARGEDTRIEMALFSRYPIAEDHAFNRETFGVTLHSPSTGERKRARFRVGRGFLNCRIEVAPGYSLQVMTAHLKSKWPEKSVEGEEGEPGDAYVRRNEARLLRRHVDTFLKDHPGQDLLVMGDFNDTPDSRTVAEVLKGGSLAELPLADYLGDRWTEWFRQRRSYEQIDYLFADDSLRARFLPGESFLFRPKADDPPDLDPREASDHRPLCARFSLP
ncbi:MAG: endonuclease/exonuclease/phosphatase family protein [Verrucomicrobium sp.]|nr:endonuclease/exonuclease/phosphatase family protein [Verrucomicrobium sp.]